MLKVSSAEFSSSIQMRCSGRPLCSTMARNSRPRLQNTQRMRRRSAGSLRRYPAASTISGSATGNRLSTMFQSDINTGGAKPEKTTRLMRVRLTTRASAIGTIKAMRRPRRSRGDRPAPASASAARYSPGKVTTKLTMRPRTLAPSPAITGNGEFCSRFCMKMPNANRHSPQAAQSRPRQSVSRNSASSANEIGSAERAAMAPKWVRSGTASTIAVSD